MNGLGFSSGIINMAPALGSVFESRNNTGEKLKIMVILIVRKNGFGNFIVMMLLLCVSSNLKAAYSPSNSDTIYYIDDVYAPTRWGIEFTGQGWTMDGKEFLNDMNTWDAVTTDFGLGMTGKVTSGRLGGAASLFVEGNSLFCMGAAVGYGVMPAVSSKLRLTSISSYFNADLNNKMELLELQCTNVEKIVLQSRLNEAFSSLPQVRSILSRKYCQS